jgi:uncharacterized protein YbcI
VPNVAEAGETEREAAREEIRREILRVHDEAYGSGAWNMDVHILDDTVLLLIDVDLSRSEQTLVAADQPDAVKGMREAFQVAIEPTFTAIVERATGRRVRSFHSSMNMDPVYSIELFRLEPRA